MTNTILHSNGDNYESNDDNDCRVSRTSIKRTVSIVLVYLIILNAKRLSDELRVFISMIKLL